MDKYPSKLYLPDVPRIGFNIHTCPFPGSLFACLETIKDPCDYDYLMAVTGAAFRRLWNRDDGGNVDLSYLGDAPFQRVFAALGYEWQSYPFEREAMLAGIRDSLNRGIPAISFAFDPSGVAAIDFLLSDAVHTPPDEAQDFAERLVLLPYARFAYRPPLPIQAAPPAALRRGYVTFGSFNRHAKHTARWREPGHGSSRRSPAPGCRCVPRPIAPPRRSTSFAIAGARWACRSSVSTSPRSWRSTRLRLARRKRLAMGSAMRRKPFVPHGAHRLHVQPPWSYGQMYPVT